MDPGEALVDAEDDELTAFKADAAVHRPLRTAPQQCNSLSYSTSPSHHPWRVTSNLRQNRVLEGEDHVRHLLASQSQNIFRRLNFQFFVKITIFM